MHMNITSVLRRTSSPTAPIVKSDRGEHRGSRSGVIVDDARSRRAPRSLGVAAARPARWPLRRASTTPPTTAITSSTAVISNAQRKSVNRLVASVVHVAACAASSSAPRVECAPVTQWLPGEHEDLRRAAARRARSRPAAGTRLRLVERLVLVDAEQHDHEQEQHDDRARVHDDLDARRARRPAAGTAPRR